MKNPMKLSRTEKSEERTQPLNFKQTVHLKLPRIQGREFILNNFVVNPLKKNTSKTEKSYDLSKLSIDNLHQAFPHTAPIF